MDTLERIKVLINSATPIILMETVEETRAVALVHEAASALNLPVFEWSIADGLTRTAAGDQKAAAADPARVTPAVLPPSGVVMSDLSRKIAAAKQAMYQAGVPQIDFGQADRPAQAQSGPILNTKDAAGVLGHIGTMTVDAIFILKDFHRQLDDATTCRLLRETAQDFGRQRRAMVLTGPSFQLPAELEKQVEYVDMTLPDRARLRAIAEETFHRLAETRSLKRTLDAAGMDALAANLTGLTEDEAERAVAQGIVAHYALCPEVVTDVLTSKKEMLRRSGMLEFIDAVNDLSTVGGLENLKKWLGQRRGAFGPGAAEFGLEPPRGVILMGVQGCGKSLAARAVAGSWKLPLVKLDTGAIFDKYIGETEKRVHKLFAVAEQLAPVVLWIDELEKVFAGSGPDSASADAGVSSRLLGEFLSWMQDRKAPVFVAATSNNVQVLPPELIRKGRFDEIFFVDLPNAVERHAIFALHIAKRKRDPKQFDLDALVAAAEGYSGAEIEAAVQASLYASFTDHKPLTTETILDAVRDSVPLATTRAEDIEQLRSWARDRAVAASATDSAAAARK
jgi:hypothetical protein